MTPDAVVFVAGHRGLVGSAIVRHLRSAGFTKLLLPSRNELDLRQQSCVEQFFSSERPEYVFLAAARVGGILANSQNPATFIYDNLTIQSNVVDAAFRHGCRKLLLLGSSCIYPKHAAQPLTEECLLTGPLEETNEPYAIAKIAGLKLAQAYRRQHGFDAITLMPTNLYGPGDNFDLTSSHVLPALLRKMHEAKSSGVENVEIWGTGCPRREFLHVDDLADACVFLMQRYEDERPINVGWGKDIAIKELAELMSKIVGYRGKLSFDPSKPDGTPRKLLDVTRMSELGWEPRIDLESGIRATYGWFVENGRVANG